MIKKLLSLAFVVVMAVQGFGQSMPAQNGHDNWSYIYPSHYAILVDAKESSVPMDHATTGTLVRATENVADVKALFTAILARENANYVLLNEWHFFEPEHIAQRAIFVAEINRINATRYTRVVDEDSDAFLAIEDYEEEIAGYYTTIEEQHDLQETAYDDSAYTVTQQYLDELDACCETLTCTIPATEYVRDYLALWETWLPTPRDEMEALFETIDAYMVLNGF